MKKRFYTSEAEACFPLYANTVGLAEPQEPRYRPQGLGAHQIMLVNGGHGILEVGTKQYDLHAGDVFFLKKNQPHSYYGADADFSTSWVSFDGEGVERLLSYYGVTSSVVFCAQYHGKFEQKLSSLHKIFDSDIGIPALMLGAYDCVIGFFDDAFRSEPTQPEIIKSFLERHFAEPLTLEDIFADCKYSKSKLSRDFKKKYGETVFDMLTRIRLSNAKKQMEEDPTLKVKDVALSCGFQDCSYFCRMYKRAFGKSPKGDRA